MLTLVPKFTLNTTISELIFVVDRYDIIQITCDNIKKILLCSTNIGILFEMG
jgi:hypothetical protein